MAKEEIGVVTHYFNKIGVAVVKLSGSVKDGDKLAFEGANTNFEQAAESMQIDRKPITNATAGQDIGMKTAQPVRENDKVYKVTD